MGSLMKISAKGRYGLAAMTCLARNFASGSPITIISISEKLGISKIYLEQVFSLLKRAQLVNSIKGSQGGYQLSREPREISQDSMSLTAKVFDPLDEKIRHTLASVSLDDILTAIDAEKETDSLMYFI